MMRWYFIRLERTVRFDGEKYYQYQLYVRNIDSRRNSLSLGVEKYINFCVLVFN